jgi:hypothetical protein
LPGALGPDPFHGAGQPGSFVKPNAIIGQSAFSAQLSPGDVVVRIAGNLPDATSLQDD